MANKSTLNQKRNGKYYTPKELANFLVKPVIEKRSKSILDPAYGDGALLLAVGRALVDHGVSNLHEIIFGCDKQPLNGHLAHLPESNLVKGDFFDYPFQRKFDTIVMNPPYIRHHLTSDRKKTKYQEQTAGLCKLNNKSDLWGYFLVKATSLVNDGGSVGAILPWSFLQAEYAIPIRGLLASSFGEIKVLALGADFFDQAEERIVMVWLKDYGKKNRSIKISFSQHIGEGISYEDLSQKQWKSPTVLFSKNHDVQNILDTYVEKFGFQKLGDLAKISIGVVTGADDFFLLTEREAIEKGFSTKHFVPIIRSSREFSGLYMNGKEIKYRLLKIDKKQSIKYKEYIGEGLKQGFHERAHSVRREPWFQVNVGETPDAFFPYRATMVPYMVLNKHRVQCTNSIHRLYFNDVNRIETKWIQVSLLSAAGQLSLEAYSKVYGTGVLKIEPSSLKRSLVYKVNDKDVESVYEKCSKLLVSNEKNKAIVVANAFINKKLNIPSDLSEGALLALKELQDRRFERTS